MTGILQATGQPCMNGDFTMTITATRLLQIQMYAYVIGPTSVEPPLTYGDWLGSAYITGDSTIPIETRTKGAEGTSLASTFRVPQLGGASEGDHCWLGLFGNWTPLSGDLPEAVLQLPNIAARR